MLFVSSESWLSTRGLGDPSLMVRAKLATIVAADRCSRDGPRRMGAMVRKAAPPGGFDGTLVVGRFLVAYVGRGGRSDLHSHHAVQIVVAREQSFSLTTADGTRQVRAACVPAGEEHAFDAEGAEIGLVLVDRHHPRGASLDAAVRKMEWRAGRRASSGPCVGRAATLSRSSR